MNQQELVQKLRDYAAEEEAFSGHRATLANYIADYTERLDLTYFERYSRKVEHSLQQIVVGAINEIHRYRTERPENISASDVTDFDKIYWLDDDCKWNGLYPAGLNMAIDIVRDVTGSKEIAENVDKVLRPEWHAIHATFFRFLDEVYSKGLYQEIRDRHPKQVKREFSNTTLACWEGGGRMAIGFVRGDDVLTFLGDTEDVHGYTAGITVYHTDLSTAIAMIEDVITGWPAHTKSRVKPAR